MVIKKTNMTLVLQKQLSNLVSQCSEEMNKPQISNISPTNLIQDELSNNDMDMNDYQMKWKKLSLLLSIKRLKRKRMALVKEVVANQARSRHGRWAKEYRGWLLECIGEGEDVDGMLPDIVGELRGMAGDGKEV